MPKVADIKTQMRLIRVEYEANGFTVYEDAPASLLGLDLSFPLKFICMSPEGSVIVEVLSHQTDEAVAMERIDDIGFAIQGIPEIEFEVRLIDISADVLDFTSALLKLRDANPTDPAYQVVVDLANKFSLITE